MNDGAQNAVDERRIPVLEQAHGKMSDRERRAIVTTHPV